MKVVLLGYGKMGKAIETLCRQLSHEIIGKITSTFRDFSIVERADVCIDFSSSSGVLGNIRMLAPIKKPLIIGTTGWEEGVAEAKLLVDKIRFPLLFAPNFSIGIHLFQKVLKKAHELFLPFNYSIAALEMHHENKKDRPSGTAKTLETVLNNNCKTVSIRSGYYPGVHKVFFDVPEETIEISHTARNREGLARGALEAAQWLTKKEKGFFTFDDFMNERML